MPINLNTTFTSNCAKPGSDLAATGCRFSNVTCAGLLWLATAGLAGVAAGEPAENQLDSARRLAQSGQFQESLQVVQTLLETNPKDSEARQLRAMIYDSQRDWPQALLDYDQLIRDHPDTHALHQHRGLTRFRSGDVPGSVEDFDAAIRLFPSLERKHWQRGLAYYVLEEYEKGARQFALYQTHYGADVENVVWHMACLARDTDFATAQPKMLRLEGVDDRVPLMTVDALFRGTSNPEAVLEAASRVPQDTDPGKEARLYAELYLALYFDARQDPTSRDQHLQRAVDNQLDYYMWDVAHVWLDRIRKPAQK